MNNNLINEINNMRSIMGLNSKPVLLESINPTLLKKIWQNVPTEKLEDFLPKVFNLSDNELSSILSRVQQEGGGLSDDVAELLLRKAKTDMSGVAKVLKLGGYLPEVETLSKRILQKVDEMPTVTAEQRDTLILAFEDSIDQLGFISDELRDELVKDFTEEIQLKVSSKLAISDLLVDLNQDVTEFVTLPRTYWEKIMGKEPKVITKLENNLRNYEQAMRIARKEGSILKDYTLEDFTKLLDDFKSNATELNPQLVEELNKIYNRQSFRKAWVKMSPLKKITWILGTVGFGPTVLLVLGYLIKTRFTNIGDVKAIIGLIDSGEAMLRGDVDKLTEKNIKEAILKDYLVDGDTFSNEYKIYINNDGQTARVRGPQNFTVKINADRQIDVTKN